MALLMVWIQLNFLSTHPGSRQAQDFGHRLVHGDRWHRAHHHHQRHQQQREGKDHELSGEILVIN